MSEAPEIIFYHAPRTRSGIVHVMLEELGQPFEMRVLDLSQGEHKQPDFLAINPMGKVPAIVHRGTVVTEVGAICCHLADAYPASGLAVPIADPRRGTYLRWLFFGVGCLEPAILDRMLKRAAASPQTLSYGDFDTVIEVISRAISPGPYVLGDQFCAADVVIGASLRWSLMMDLIPKDTKLSDYVERLSQRPAVQRAMAKDAALAEARDRQA